MKAYMGSIAALIFGVYMVTSCTKKEDNTPCGPPNTVNIDTTCYAGKGLLVTASNYSGAPSTFDWTIIALKDTTSKLGWTNTDIKYDGPGSATFTVADSLVSNYQKLIIGVASNCQGIFYHSITYGFIKSRSATNTCTVWKPIKR